MIITSFFTDEGSPKTGITPTIRIRDLSDNSLVVTDQNMSEVGDGFYKYDFTSYDNTKNYAIRCDGGETLNGADRYMYAGNNNNELEQDLDAMDALIRRILGLTQENYRIVNPVYDLNNNMVSATIKIYNSSSDCDSDINSLSSYSVVATYDGNHNMLTYKVTKN